MNIPDVFRRLVQEQTRRSHAFIDPGHIFPQARSISLLDRLQGEYWGIGFPFSWSVTSAITMSPKVVVIPSEIEREIVLELPPVMLNHTPLHRAVFFCLCPTSFS